MIIVNLKDIIALAILALCLLVWMVLFAVAVVSSSVAKHQQKRIDKAFPGDKEKQK